LYNRKYWLGWPAWVEFNMGKYGGGRNDSASDFEIITFYLPTHHEIEGGKI